MSDFSFTPNPEQARRKNGAMHRALSDSVDYLVTVLEAHNLSTRQADLQKWKDKISAGERLRPAAFGAYYDLVQAMQSDTHPLIIPNFEDMIDLKHFSERTETYRLGRDYTSQETDRFQRYMGNGKTGASGIAPAREKDAKRFEAVLAKALAWLREEAPELSAEFHELIQDIILVAPDHQSQNVFEGGSSFKLWGALFLNAESAFSTAELITSLAHEQGHSVLFSACKDHMLVENLDDELYWSPIRQAKRPLEGIFHATFVSARMGWVLLKLRAWPGLAPQDHRGVERDLAEALRTYEEGLEIVRENARFTPIGRQVFIELEREASPLFERV